MTIKPKFLVFLAVTALFFSAAVRQPSVSARAGDNTQVDSDLSLDLKNARLDPSPWQVSIVAAETPQVVQIQVSPTKVITTTTSVPEDRVDPEAAKESADQISHPEQTSSEQMSTITVTVPVSQPSVENSPSATPEGQPVNSPGRKTPDSASKTTSPQTGTDDNAAPSTLPESPDKPGTPAQPGNETPTTPSGQETNPAPVNSSGSSQNNSTPGSTSPSGGDQPSIPTTNPGDSIPSENNSVFVPGPAPTAPSDATAPPSAPASDQAPAPEPAPASSSEAPSSDQVQGAATGPSLLQTILNFLFRR